MTSAEEKLDEIMTRLEKAERTNTRYAEHLVRLTGAIGALEVTKRNELIKLTDLPEFSGL